MMKLIGLLIGASMFLSGAALAQGACDTPYGGLSLKLSAPWSVTTCAKTDMFAKYPQHPNTIALRAVNQEKGTGLLLVLKKSPGPGHTEQTFVNEQIAAYAKGPNGVTYNHRSLEEETVVREINGVTYKAWHVTYSINESQGVIKNKRPVAFIFFKYHGYEAFAFLRVLDEKGTWQPAGETFSTNEHPREQAEQILAGFSFGQ